jgi:hypothetical protein
VTVGLPQPPAAADNAPYTYLEKPTPFQANSAAKAGTGPFIRRWASLGGGGGPFTVQYNGTWLGDNNFGTSQRSKGSTAYQRHGSVCHLQRCAMHSQPLQLLNIALSCH